MGNAGLGGDLRLEDFCFRRGPPKFLAPNRDRVSYSFDFSADPDVKFQHCPDCPLLPEGLLLDHPEGTQKWYCVKECPLSPAQLRLQMSGRVFVQCADTHPSAVPASASGGACAFKIRSRGRPVYESVRTRTFTHTAHISTSGIVFALYVTASAGGFYLCPRILLALGRGEELVLVDDRLGPFLAPQEFYADFAIIDEGGRNVQMDLILRAGKSLASHHKRNQPDAPLLPPRSGLAPAAMRPLRTCLQDYAALNSQVQPASVSLGSSSLSSLMPGSTAQLQNLVISEERLDARTDLYTAPPGEGAQRVLFEGEDASAASPAHEALEGGCSSLHPQLQPAGPPPLLPPEVARSGEGPADGGGGGAPPAAARRPPSAGSGWSPSADEFWYHIRYGGGGGGAEPVDLSPGPCARPIRGEFWLSKQNVEKNHVYFQLSSTLAQALTVCTVFRFSCPTDYLSLIENQATLILRNEYIPTNGVVLGVEPDPRNSSVVRMFIEHKNEILDDMVVYECRGTADVARAVAHQEIYDGGGTITYRLTLTHTDGTRQSAVLQLNTDQLDDTSLQNHLRSSHVEEPSLRFPISPCFVSHNLSPANRIFVYSATAYDAPPEVTQELFADADDTSVRCSGASDGSDGGWGTPGSCGIGPHDVKVSDAANDDWHSAGGGFSDGEADAPPAQFDAGGGRADAARGGDAPDFPRAEVAWRRPLVESVVLLGNVGEPPFKCSTP